MQAKREYRDRDETEVAVLDALVDRHEEGMTVFEVRSSTEADIDRLEDALAALKTDDLIRVEDDGETRIYPAERVVPDPTEPAPDDSLLDRLRDRLPF